MCLDMLHHRGMGGQGGVISADINARKTDTCLHPCPAWLSQGCVRDLRQLLRFDLWVHQSPANIFGGIDVVCVVCKNAPSSLSSARDCLNILSLKVPRICVRYFAHSVHLQCWQNVSRQTKKGAQVVWEPLPVLPPFVWAVMICVIQLLTGISLCRWLICFL